MILSATAGWIAEIAHDIRDSNIISTELRAAALQSSDKYRIVQIADATITVERKRGGWDYRINHVDYKLRQFEQALMMATFLPDVEQEATTWYKPSFRSIRV